MSKQAKIGTAKFIVMLIAVSLVFGGLIGGTAAWLISKPEAIINTFTYGDINITLTESPGDLDDDDQKPYTNTYKMMPGSQIEKDPTVTVKKGSEDCWLFVKLEEGNDFGDFFEAFNVASGNGNFVWTELSDNAADSGIYYCLVKADDVDDADLALSVIENDTLTVKSSITKDDFEKMGTNYPTLTVTAYAVQYSGFEVKDGNNDIISDLSKATEEQFEKAASGAWAVANEP